MSYSAAKTIFGNLKNAETVSYCINRGEGAAYVGTSPANSAKQIVSIVDDAYFDIFRFHFVSGNPFTAEQAAAVRREAIITDKLALKLFNTEDATGKNIQVNFRDYRVTGVVKSFSSLFHKAYSDVWLIVNKEDMNWAPSQSEGLLGNCEAIVLAKKGVSLKTLEEEIDANIEKLNKNLQEFTFEQRVFSQAQSSFFSNKTVNPAKIFIVLILIILIVPTINMSGLLSTQMKKRGEEIGIRKAYGANNRQVVGQLLFENLILTLLGGLIGLILSFIVVGVFKNLLLADVMTINVGAENFNLPLSVLFHPMIFVAVLLFCLFINLLSGILPAWKASRTTIIDTMKGE